MFLNQFKRMNVKRSHVAKNNDQINVIDLPNGGTIGMMACPGLGQIENNVVEDVQLIKDWGASVVVTLMETF